MTEDPKLNNEQELLTEIPTRQPRNWTGLALIISLILIPALFGSFSGWYFWNQKLEVNQQVVSSSPLLKQVPIAQEDMKTFRDSAEGVLEVNDNLAQYTQGTHKLVRSGGPSQTVYLVSSVVDLNQYVGKKVKVWGETFESREVGWLMDVGRVEEIQ